MTIQDLRYSLNDSSTDFIHLFFSNKREAVAYNHSAFMWFGFSCLIVRPEYVFLFSTHFLGLSNSAFMMESPVISGAQEYSCCVVEGPGGADLVILCVHQRQSWTGSQALSLQGTSPSWHSVQLLCCKGKWEDACSVWAGQTNPALLLLHMKHDGMEKMLQKLSPPSSLGSSSIRLLPACQTLE